MGNTIIDQAVERVVNKKMTDRDWAHTIAIGLSRMQQGYYEEWWLDVVCQKWERFDYNIYDAYAFLNVHTWGNLGEVVMARIFIGKGPKKDKEAIENNKILSKLGHGFSAKFWGGTQDEDGYFDLEVPIDFNAMNRETGEMVYSKVESKRFPLEVGYTSAAKTMNYLNGPFGCLARWPYHHKDIWLMKRLWPKDRDYPFSFPYRGRVNQIPLPI